MILYLLMWHQTMSLETAALCHNSSWWHWSIMYCHKSGLSHSKSYYLG